MTGAVTTTTSTGTGTGRPAAARKALGAWYTPPHLVEMVVERSITEDWVRAATADGRAATVLDPACGDGRFLRAARRRIVHLGGRAELTGVDIDPRATSAVTDSGPDDLPEVLTVDALGHPWEDRQFDLVVGNPPFLSQMAAGTTRGGASRYGGGPYADTAAEFLALAVRLARPDGGRIALVLPQSVLASRDAAGIRRGVEQLADMRWWWWSPDRHFDAEVLVCALGFERNGHPSDQAGASRTGTDQAGPSRAGASHTTWSHVVAGRLGVPELPQLHTAGTLGDRATLNANFRDEYYGLVPAVSDDADGPPLVSTGLIDPGRCWWGELPMRFAKRTFAAPRVDRSLLDARMQAWATRKLVPKVLVANQTTVIEAVVDADGAWLPAVPITSIVPVDGLDPWALGAVLTSPVATVAAWHGTAGTGMSARAIRLGPAVLASVPWPAGDLGSAVAALRAGDVIGCGEAVTLAFGVDLDDPIVAWWRTEVERVADTAARRSGSAVRPRRHPMAEPDAEPAT